MEYTTGYDTSRAPTTAPRNAGDTPAIGGPGNDAIQAGLSNSGTCDTDRLNDLFDAISDKYTQLLIERARGVEELRQDAHEKDPPPAWQSIAIAVGTIALSAATAGIGGAVASALAGAVVDQASKVVAKGVESAIKTTVDKSLNTGITAAIGAAAPAASNVTDAFFRGQSDALHMASGATQDAFNLQGRTSIRHAQDPCATARALFEALNSAFGTAKTTQRQHTLASWANFLARAELGTDGRGTHHEGVDLGDQLGDTSAAGVLGLVIESPGGQNPVRITDAEIEGLNEPLRNELASRPIGQLGIAITAHGEINPPSFAEEFFGVRSYADGIVRIGKNESGTMWNRSSPGGNEYLMWRGIGGPVLTGPEGFHPGESERESYLWAGIRKVIDEDIGTKTLSSIGVELEG